MDARSSMVRLWIQQRLKCARADQIRLFLPAGRMGVDVQPYLDDVRYGNAPDIDRTPKHRFRSRRLPENDVGGLSGFDVSEVPPGTEADAVQARPRMGRESVERRLSCVAQSVSVRRGRLRPVTTPRASGPPLRGS